MKQEPSLLTNFTLNELEGAEADQVSLMLKNDPVAQQEVEEIRKVTRLMEMALQAEPLPVSRVPSLRRKWIIGSVTAAVASLLLVIAVPHPRSVSVVEEAFAESYSPGVNKEAIRQVIRSHLTELRTCYEDQLKTNPGLAGKVLLHFGFDENGVVSEASVKRSTMPSAPLSACIVDHVKTWKFSGAPKGVTALVEYPFVFDSK